MAHNVHNIVYQPAKTHLTSDQPSSLHCSKQITHRKTAWMKPKHHIIYMTPSQNMTVVMLQLLNLKPQH